ncbi:hypothetical protein [uncultured Paracoccus sp.]|uniref:hypothetical protein n=1 Tax=uncultured Paracoccus sp. TaxID=189685 RepID=UPI0026023B68|nr:hypothetical protein [uncultured Paracoccus sp.]
MAGPDPTRLERTQALFDAIAACDRADAEFILSGVLAEMGAGPPLPALRAVEEEGGSLGGLCDIAGTDGLFLRHRRAPERAPAWRTGTHAPHAPAPR